MEQDDDDRDSNTADLARLLEEHPDTLRSALLAAAALADKLPKDFAPSEESAHVFRVGTPPEGQQ